MLITFLLKNKSENFFHFRFFRNVDIIFINRDKEIYIFNKHSKCTLLVAILIKEILFIGYHNVDV